MACIRERRGKYVLDYRDQWGKRRWVSYDLTPEGLAAATAEKDRVEGGGIEAGLTVQQYIERFWLPLMAKRLDPDSLKGYEGNARLHIPPSIKRARLKDVGRAQVKRFLATLGQDHGLGEESVAKVANVVRSIFEAALDDGLVTVNPASALRLSLGMVSPEPEVVRAMDAGQLDLFLSTAKLKAADQALAFHVMAYTGVRIGEMRGLQLTDLDFEERTIVVQRQVHRDGRVGPVKGTRGKRRPRIVNMAEALYAELEPAIQARRVYALRTANRGPWLLYPDWPDVETEHGATFVRASVWSFDHRLRRAMSAVLKAARLPDHFTPHSFRHTFARVLLERGEEPIYVQRQLGHASLSMTTDRYGHWARVKPREGGADLLRRKG